MKIAFLATIGVAATMSSAQPSPRVNHWKLWLDFEGGVLLNSPEKAIDFSEAIIRARYGQNEIDEERPFVAIDCGDTWQVRGTNGGSHILPYLSWISIVVVEKKSGTIVDFWHQMSDADQHRLERGSGPSSPGK